MPISKALGASLLLACLLGVGGHARNAFQIGPSKNADTEGRDADLPRFCFEVLNQVMSAGYLAEFPKDSKWIVTVRILPAFEKRETLLTARKFYSGDVQGSLAVPVGESVYGQCRALKVKNAAASPFEVAQAITVKRVAISAKDLPRLSEMGDRLEGIKMSPVMPDTLSVDQAKYEIWSQSLYGQRLQVVLVGPEDGDGIHSHPLLEWVAEYRKLLNDYQTAPKARKN